jgi:sugar lactone lactonase YvrE
MQLVSCGGGGGSSDSAAASTGTGTISVLAGHVGGPGSLDGKPNRFDSPSALAVDSSGTVYVADSMNNTIRRISPAGVASTYAGLPLSVGKSDGTGAAARFNYPQGLAVDSDGTVYVADTYNQLIRKIAPGGVVSTFAGSGQVGQADGQGTAATFSAPWAIALDGSHNLYVADGANNCVRKITPGGLVSTVSGSINSLINSPEAIAVNASGSRIIVTSPYNHLVVEIDPGLTFTLAGDITHSTSVNGNGAAAGFTIPKGLAMDSAGNVFVSDSAGNEAPFNIFSTYSGGPNQNLIRKITPAGDVTTLAGGGSNTSGNGDGTGSAAVFLEPRGMSLASTGVLYVADASASTIRTVSTTGQVSTFAGEVAHTGLINGTGSAAYFDAPYHLTQAAAGKFNVTDFHNNTVRQVTPAGAVTVLPGAPTSVSTTSNPLASPVGLVTDPQGNTFMTTADCRILELGSNGAITTVAGITSSCSGQDGTLPSVTFANPNSITADSNGTLFVTDNQAMRVIMGGVAGTVMTAATNDYFVDGTPDSSGNLYVAESHFFGINADNNCSVRKRTPSGVESTITTTLTACDAMTLDSKGNIFVAGNGVILRLANGSSSTIAGTLNQYGAEAGPLPGTLGRIRGLLVDSEGDLIATSENAILKITLP